MTFDPFNIPFATTIFVFLFFFDTSNDFETLDWVLGVTLWRFSNVTFRWVFRFVIGFL